MVPGDVVLLWPTIAHGWLPATAATSVGMPWAAAREQELQRSRAGSVILGSCGSDSGGASSSVAGESTLRTPERGMRSGPNRSSVFRSPAVKLAAVVAAAASGEDSHEPAGRGDSMVGSITVFGSCASVSSPMSITVALPKRVLRYS